MQVTHTITLADNGILMLSQEEGCDDSYMVFPDTDIITVLGKELWGEIKQCADHTLCNKIKVTITLEQAC